MIVELFLIPGANNDPKAQRSNTSKEGEDWAFNPKKLKFFERG